MDTDEHKLFTLPNRQSKYHRDLRASQWLFKKESQNRVFWAWILYCGQNIFLPVKTNFRDSDDCFCAADLSRERLNLFTGIGRTKGKYQRASVLICGQNCLKTLASGCPFACIVRSKK